MINKQTRDKIVVQALNEKTFARTYKQSRISSWQKNEDMYYGRKRFPNQDNSQLIAPGQQATASANVELGKMQAYVNTLLSKIDSPLTFKYVKGTLADLKRAKYLNALKEKDANIGNWNYKDLLGKKQAVIYGRAIYAYYADSYNGYCSHLRNIDVYDFLTDPDGGGMDLEDGNYHGIYGVKKNKQELRDGKKAGIYITTEVNTLLQGEGNNTEITQETINQQNRYQNLGTQASRVLYNADIFVFWEWFTTYEGERYYLLMTEDGIAIRVEKLKDLFKSDLWPIWTYAAFPDLTEFWTPSYCDYVREIFMAQSISINQMLDNSDRINKPQRAIDVNAIESLADLAYRRNGIIRMKNGTDINKAFRIVETPALTTPITLYTTLEGIANTNGGVTAGDKGTAQEDKVGIYEGNQANSADKFGLFNKSYTQGYKKFAVLYRAGVEEHLSKKTSIKILGPDGIDKTIYINKRDVKPSVDYDVLIEASNAEAQADAIDKKNKLTFLGTYKDNQLVNQKSIFEMQATIAGLSADDIRMLLDTSDYGEAELLSECDRDIEELLAGKVIEPNRRANTAYAQRFLDYMTDHQEDMTGDEFILFVDYFEKLKEIVMKNMVNTLQSQLAKEGATLGLDNGGGEGAPAQDIKADETITPEVTGQPLGQLQNNEPTAQPAPPGAEVKYAA